MSTDREREAGFGGEISKMAAAGWGILLLSSVNDLLARVTEHQGLRISYILAFPIIPIIIEYKMNE